MINTTTYLTVTFCNITECDRDRIIEYCNQSDHDYDYLLDPLDGSIEVFGMKDEHYQELNQIIS